MSGIWSSLSGAATDGSDAREQACAVASKKGRAEVPHEVMTGRRVLLVEDSWLIAQGYKTVLEMSGVQVIGPAANIEDAEELLLAHVPDLAIVDIDLDGVMTYGLIETLIARDIPVVVISGNAVRPSVAARVDLVLSKPVGGAALLSALRRVAAVRHFQ